MSPAARVPVLLAVALLPLLSGCEVGYYAHLARGEYKLLAAREPIDELLVRPGIDAALKTRLEHARDARAFATTALALPDNDSYTDYADLGRPYAIVNVMATPEFSVEPHPWCYFIWWCYAYRGYYDLEQAKAEGKRLRDEGLDVMLGYVPAYSTLGWTDDPILNTMGQDDAVIASTIFHELAHQVEYARNDTAFNESFATFVQEQGLRLYLKDEPELARDVELKQRHKTQFVALMLGVRRRLETLYQSGLPAEVLRERKHEKFERLTLDYAALKKGWGGDTRMDFWMQGELNNATLLSFGIYDEWVPAFAALFKSVQDDWPRFYQEVHVLADLGDVERHRRLKALEKGDATLFHQ